MGGLSETSKPSQESRTPVLDEFSRDLTRLAIENKLDPVIGREKEIERVVDFGRRKNNPVLLENQE